MLEERIRQLEATVSRLANQLDAKPPGAGGGPSPAGGGAADRAGPMSARPPPPRPRQPREGRRPRASRSPRTRRPRRDSTCRRPSRAVRATSSSARASRSGPNDDEFILQFHNLTQFDYRGYEQGGQDPVHDTFDFPRQWFMFSGRITQALRLLRLARQRLRQPLAARRLPRLHYDPRLQFRVGRFKTPFTYEFFVEPIQGLLSPERSLFFNNFGQNRDLGVMAFGRLFDKKLDYAVGIFNGTRNGFVDLNDAKNVSAFLNWKPFGDEEETLLENFNIGGSVFAGNQNNIPIPQTLRTIVPTAGNPVARRPVPRVQQRRPRVGRHGVLGPPRGLVLPQLSVIGEWGSGFQDYALANNLQARTNLPVQSFYVQAGYFLTGETASSVGIVKPLRPFDLRKGHFGLGAFELTGRYAYMDIGREVFTNGLADPNLWTNRLSLTDVGLNWHLTQYLKVYLDWQHADFGSPVQFAPGRRQSTSDMFLLRAQLFF